MAPFPCIATITGPSLGGGAENSNKQEVLEECNPSIERTIEALHPEPEGSWENEWGGSENEWCPLAWDVGLRMMRSG